MDTTSVGMTISFVMGCIENETLSQEDADEVDLSFGNAEGLLDLAEKSAKREGFGQELAEGAGRAARWIDPGAVRFLLTV